ncbi:MAG: tetratricopeptide repeat protein, partial [Nannocystaceae bacterium]
VHTLGYLNNLAATLMFSGSYEEAQPVYLDIVERTARSLGDDHPQLIPGLLGLARVERELLRPADAATRLERALSISLERGERPERIGTVQFQLAQALWDSGQDQARALDLARASAQSFFTAREDGWDIGERIDEVRAWLDERAPSAPR